MFVKEPPIADVRFEPEGEGVADAGDDSDRFVDQDVKTHPDQDDAGNTASGGINQRERRDHGRSGIAHPRDESDQRVETKTKACSGNAHELVHDLREPIVEPARKSRAHPLFRRKNLPLNFLCLHDGLIAARTTVRPRSRSVEFIAFTIQSFASSMVWYRFLSRR